MKRKRDYTIVQSLIDLLFVYYCLGNGVGSNSVNSYGINNLLNSVNCSGVLNGLSLLCTVSARSERNSCYSYEHEC